MLPEQELVEALSTIERLEAKLERLEKSARALIYARTWLSQAQEIEAVSALVATLKGEEDG